MLRSIRNNDLYNNIVIHKEEKENARRYGTEHCFCNKKQGKLQEYLISTIVLGLFIYIDSCAKTKIFKK